MKAVFIMKFSSTMINNAQLVNTLKTHKIAYKVIKNDLGLQLAIEYNANKPTTLNLRKLVENSCKKFGHNEYFFIYNRKGVKHEIKTN